jgi:hypothetical protein
MLGGVGPPRAPARAALREGTGVFWEPQLFGGEPNTKISCGERIRVAETTHGDDLGRPRTDTGQCCQLFPGALPVATRMEDHTPVGERINQRNHRMLSSLGEGQIGRIDVRELLDCRKDVRQTAGRVSDGLAVRGT